MSRSFSAVSEDSGDEAIKGPPGPKIRVNQGDEEMGRIPD